MDQIYIYIFPAALINFAETLVTTEGDTSILCG